MIFFVICDDQKYQIDGLQNNLRFLKKNETLLTVSSYVILYEEILWIG